MTSLADFTLSFNEPMCEPCSENHEKHNAVRYCRTCDEYLCVTCTSMHKTIKATKLHTPITLEEKRMQELVKCDPCNADNEIIEASKYCNDCQEYLCDHCASVHKRMKVTKTHVLVAKEKVASTQCGNIEMCDICKEDNTEKIASQFCTVCEEYLCNGCCKAHKLQKASRTHETIPIAEHQKNKQKSMQKCEPCEKMGKIVHCSMFCMECKEMLCDVCVVIHGSLKVTRHHKIVEQSKPNKCEEIEIECEPCKAQKKITTAKYFCCNCEENLCLNCGEQHRAQKLTREHELTDAIENYKKSLRFCDICQQLGSNAPVSEIFCNDCREYMCKDCKARHFASVSSKNHTYCSVSEAQSLIEKSKVLCQPCKNLGETVAAVCLCADCDNEALCAKCLEIHHVQQNTRHHETTSDLMPRQQSTTTIRYVSFKKLIFPIKIPIISK